MNHVDFYGHSDADMLELGNGLNIQQERTHFALWAAMKSPLLIGTDLARINGESLAILKNKPLLQFNQDQTFGKPAQPFRWNWSCTVKNPARYWAGQYSGGVMVWLFNSNSHSDKMSVPTREIPGLPPAKSYSVVGAWDGRKKCITDVLEASSIAAHDTLVFTVKPDNCVDMKENIVLQDPDLGY
jgi:alpha-galactosidase